MNMMNHDQCSLTGMPKYLPRGTPPCGISSSCPVAQLSISSAGYGVREAEHEPGTIATLFDLYLHLGGYCFLGLWHVDFQNAILVAGFNLLGIYCRGQGDG